MHLLLTTIPRTTPPSFIHHFFMAASVCFVFGSPVMALRTAHPAQSVTFGLVLSVAKGCFECSGMVNWMSSWFQYLEIGRWADVGWKRVLATSSLDLGWRGAPGALLLATALTAAAVSDPSPFQRGDHPPRPQTHPRRSINHQPVLYQF